MKAIILCLIALGACLPPVMAAPPTKDSAGLATGPATVKGISITLPEGFVQTADTVEMVSGRLPQLKAEEAFASWQSGSQTIRLQVWTPFPPYPGGPMQVARSWKLPVGGLETSMVETKFFDGREAQVLVCFFSLKNPDRQIRIVGEKIGQAEFEAILRTIRLP